MEHIRYSIDPFKETEEQAKDVIKLLRPVLPLKIEQVQPLKKRYTLLHNPV